MADSVMFSTRGSDLQSDFKSRLIRHLHHGIE